jgi:hypothetical protein
METLPAAQSLPQDNEMSSSENTICPEPISDDLQSLREKLLENLSALSLPEEISPTPPLAPRPAVTQSDYFHLSNSASKGNHYRATQYIHRGKILVREKSYYTISNSDIPQTYRERGYSRLAYAALLLYFQRSAFTGRHIDNLNLSSKLQKRMKKNAKLDDYDLFYLKVLTHSFDIDSYDNTSHGEPCHSTGFYEIAQNFNHSCQPNCKHCFNLKTNEIIVIANENIDIGEELTISYMGPQPQGCPDELWYRTLKKSFLERYGETCSCQKCVSC